MSFTFLTGSPFDVVKLWRRQPGSQSVKPLRLSVSKEEHRRGRCGEEITLYGILRVGFYD